MFTLFAVLHFLGASFLIGGEPLVAIIAIKAEKNESTLRFFVGFLRTIAAFMWVGVGLTLIGGLGMYLKGGYHANTLFLIKMILYVLVIVVSFLLLVNIPKVQRIAQRNFTNLRNDPTFKQLDTLSKVDMLLIMAILIVSVIMYS